MLIVLNEIEKKNAADFKELCLKVNTLSDNPVALEFTYTVRDVPGLGYSCKLRCDSLLVEADITDYDSF